jgi:hypothetical protein
MVSKRAKTQVTATARPVAPQSKFCNSQAQMEGSGKSTIEYGRGSRKADRVGRTRFQFSIMRSLIFSTARFTLFAALIMACHGMASGQETIINLDQMTKYLNGVQTSENLNNRGDIAVIAIRDANNAYYFTSNAHFETWAGDVPNGAELVTRNKAMEAIYNYVQANGYQNLEEGAPLPANLQSFINQQLPGVLNQGQTENLWFCKYFDGLNFTGPDKFCSGNFWPNLGSFRNRAESVLGSGVGSVSFCDHKWFGGQKFHIILVGYFSIQNLGGMNNRIESHIAF